MDDLKVGDLVYVVNCPSKFFIGKFGFINRIKKTICGKTYYGVTIDIDMDVYFCPEWLIKIG